MRTQDISPREPLTATPSFGRRPMPSERGGSLPCSQTWRARGRLLGNSIKPRWLGVGLALALVWASLLADVTAAPSLAFKVLVFSKTAGYRHASIANGLAALRELGTTHHFAGVPTENSADFTDAYLAQFQAVVFLSTTGDVLNSLEQAAFERYVKAGGGFVGIHAASDTEYSWPWYGGLIGAWFSSHPSIQHALLHVEDFDHPSTRFLPAAWKRRDEWYNFQINPRPNVHVLCRLDETTYSGGTMGDHPIAWYHEYDGGRAWYTAGGHTPESFAEPWFRAHLLGGIRYAAGRMSQPPADAIALFDGRDAAHWRTTGAGGGTPWQVTNGVLVVTPGSGNLQTVQWFNDCRLHVEFLLPPSPVGTAENQLANSGVFLQGRYEIQILDSFGRSLAGANESGAIWGLRDPSTNAAWPAGTWESLDILFHAARWNDNQKTANARVSVWWNGVLVQADVEIPHPTESPTASEYPPAGPVVLQDLKGEVQFRNVWIEPLGPSPRGTATTLIPVGAAWRYLDDGSTPSAYWRAVGFDDSSWRIGHGQLGYGDGDETTVIRSDRTDGTRIITTYFRRRFTATDPWAMANLNLRLLRDDGALVYLNGAEVFRSNLPGGTITSATLAEATVGGALESFWYSTNLSPALLLDGENVLAVEVHQSGTNSSDLSFDLALSAVTFPAPPLVWELQEMDLALTWAALPAGFVLESAPGLAPTDEWQPAAGTATTVSNLQHRLQAPHGNGKSYFRLRWNGNSR